jgi:hypothetical protein
MPSHKKSIFVEPDFDQIPFELSWPKICLDGPDAMDQFNFFFGDDETDLPKMRRLCRACGVKFAEIPWTAAQCKEVRYRPAPSWRSRTD